MIDEVTAKPKSAVASQPCLSGHITADERLNPFAQIALGNFFYPQPLGEGLP